MVVTDCKFDPVRDIAPVDQYGFVDLKNALSESVVPSQLPNSDSDYNGIDDPGKVIGSPRDVFEAIDAQKALEAAAAASSSADQKEDE